MVKTRGGSSSVPAQGDRRTTSRSSSSGARGCQRRPTRAYARAAAPQPAHPSTGHNVSRAGADQHTAAPNQPISRAAAGGGTAAASAPPQAAHTAIPPPTAPIRTQVPRELRALRPTQERTGAPSSVPVLSRLRERKRLAPCEPDSEDESPGKRACTKQQLRMAGAVSCCWPCTSDCHIRNQRFHKKLVVARWRWNGRCSHWIGSLAVRVRQICLSLCACMCVAWAL